MARLFTKCVATVAVLLSGCAVSDPAVSVPVPDKQGAGLLEGAAAGAGTGAVTGFQLGAAAGPAAFVGAGIGAVAGGIQGMAQDATEDQLLVMSARLREERARAQIHELLSEHYERRREIHPTRDIFPADLFFQGDSSELSITGSGLVKELASLNRQRLPSSRLVVGTYVKTRDDTSEWGKFLAERRAIAIGDALVRYGIDARRIQTRPMLVRDVVVLDPKDRPDRYAQAVELSLADR